MSLLRGDVLYNVSGYFQLNSFRRKKRLLTFQVPVGERLCIGNEALEEHSMVPFCGIHHYLQQ